jgi:hypothetical protein
VVLESSVATIFFTLQKPVWNETNPLNWDQKKIIRLLENLTFRLEAFLVKTG